MPTDTILINNPRQPEPTPNTTPMITFKLTDTDFSPEIEFTVRFIFQYLGYEFQILKKSDEIPKEGILINYSNESLLKSNFPEIRIHPSSFFGPNYLTEASIPRNPLPVLNNEITNEVCVNPNLPVLFFSDRTGNPLLSFTGSKIICRIDLIASIFFMLSRIEEKIIPDRDSMNRFPVYESIAYKNNFLNRPIVNEYLELFDQLIKKIQPRRKRIINAYKIIPSHDIDYVYKWQNYLQHAKWRIGDVLRGENPKKNLNEFLRINLTKTGLNTDPYDTYDWLMDVSESRGLKSTFFFMSGGNTTHDNKYEIDSPNVRKILQKIIGRGHEIGLHGSYNSYDNPEMLFQEKKRLEQTIDQPVKGIRQHFLRFSVPETWAIHEQSGLEYDNTLVYPEQVGFRCGICNPYPVYDVIRRKQLNLRELPLIVMDGSLKDYQELNPAEGFEKVRELCSIVKKYHGIFSILWHNTSLNEEAWPGWKTEYQQFMESI